MRSRSEERSNVDWGQSRARHPETARLPWSVAALVIGILSVLSWVFVFGIAFAIWSAV
jgi:cytoskeletal protein RodZ